MLGPGVGPEGQLVYVLSGGDIRSAAGLTAVVFAGETGATLADIAEYDGTMVPGAVIPNSQVIVDTFSRLPRFWYPDGVDTVYVSVAGGPRIPLTAIGIATDPLAVHLAGAETITGVKTFTVSPIVPTPVNPTEAVNKSYVDAADTAIDLRLDSLEPGGANDALLVHKAGAETIAGVKTFTVSPIVPTPVADTEAVNKSYVDILTASQSVTGIPKSIIDAKGDLIVGLSNDTPTRLPVGADGLFLRANSGVAEGIDWSFFPAHTHSAADITSGMFDADRNTDGLYNSPMRLPQWPGATSLVTNFQAGHGYTNNAGSTYNANDTVTFSMGTQSARITTGGLGAQANVSRTGLAAMDLTAKAIRLRFRVADMTHMSEIGFFLGSGGFASFFKWSIWTTGSSKFIQSGDWITITLSFHDATSSGAPSRAALTDVRCFVIDNNTGNMVTVNWQSIEIIPDGSAIWPNGVISVTFDDSYDSQWSRGKPQMDLFGYRGSMYTIDEYIDTAGRMTLDQLKIMQDMVGWEIAGHMHTAANHSASYTGITAAALDSDIRHQRAQLTTWGLRGHDGTAYPLGQFGLTSDAVQTNSIVRKNWSYARTTSSRVKETFPPADRYRLRAISGISTFAGGYAPSLLTTAVTGDIDKCKAQKSWLILVFHDITTVAPTNTSEILQADYNAIITAINTAGVPVVPVGDVLRYYG